MLQVSSFRFIVVYKRFHCFLPTAFDLSTAAVVALNILPSRESRATICTTCPDRICTQFSQHLSVDMRSTYSSSMRNCVSLVVYNGLVLVRCQWRVAVCPLFTGKRDFQKHYRVNKNEQTVARVISMLTYLLSSVLISRISSRLYTRFIVGRRCVATMYRMRPELVTVGSLFLRYQIAIQRRRNSCLRFAFKIWCANSQGRK